MLHAFSYNAFEDYNDVAPPVHSTVDYRPKRVPMADSRAHSTTRRLLHSASVPDELPLATEPPKPPTPTQHDIAAIEHSAFQGRMVALQVANEEATLRGQPWPNDKNIRFHLAARQSAVAEHAMQGERPDFGSDALAELLGEATEGVRRRVVEALEGAIKARRDSERSEATVLQSLRALPHMEEDNKAIALQLLVRCHRAGERLREAMFVLEKNTAEAQATYACDRRVLTTRLVAQREAVARSMAAELADVEDKGRLSITSLLARLKEKEEVHSREKHARDKTIGDLEDKATVIQCRLEAEHELRQSERGKFESTIRRLEGEVQRLGDALQHSQQSHTTDGVVLNAQVATMEAEAAAAKVEFEKRISKLEAERRADAISHAEKLTEVSMLADRREVAISRTKEVGEKEYKQLEAHLTRRLKLTESVNTIETQKLHKRIARLEQQLKAAKRTKSTGAEC